MEYVKAPFKKSGRFLALIVGRYENDFGICFYYQDANKAPEPALLHLTNRTWTDITTQPCRVSVNESPPTSKVLRFRECVTRWERRLNRT